MTIFVHARNKNSEMRLLSYAEKRRLLPIELVQTVPSMDELQLNDIVVVDRLGDIFKSGKEAIQGLELFKSLWIELHVVEFEALVGDAKVTWGPISDLLPILIKQVTEWQSGTISTRNKRVKAEQREKSLYRGGRKEKGFTTRTVGRKQVQVVDEVDKKLLEKIVEYKERREFDMLNKGKTIWSMRNIHGELSKYYDEIISAKEGDLVTAAEKKKWRLKWKKKYTDSKGIERNVEKFGLATLYRLMDDNYHNNAKARLERIKTIQHQTIQLNLTI